MFSAALIQNHGQRSCTQEERWQPAEGDMPAPPLVDSTSSPCSAGSENETELRVREENVIR